MFELRGRLIDIVQDIRNKTFRITFEVMQLPKGLDALRDMTIRLLLKKWRDKRSITANAYYWVLVGKIAEYINQPQSVVHNILLRQYGVLDIVDGDSLTVFVPDTEEAANEVLRKETYHLRPTSKVIEGNMLGSSYYDTKQFSTLLDGAISECKEMGIETIPDDEIRRMMESYEKHSAN